MLGNSGSCSRLHGDSGLFDRVFRYAPYTLRFALWTWPKGFLPGTSHPTSRIANEGWGTNVSGPFPVCILALLDIQDHVGAMYPSISTVCEDRSQESISGLLTYQRRFCGKRYFQIPPRCLNPVHGDLQHPFSLRVIMREYVKLVPVP